MRRVDPAPEYRTNGHGVAHQQRDGAERGDGVERHGAADVDEAEKAADHAGELAGVDGDVLARVHGAEPGGVGHAVIAGEGEEVARHGGKVVYRRGALDKADEGEDDGDPDVGHGHAEDVDCWVGCCVREGGVEIGDVVADGEDCWEEEDGVEDVDGHHGSGDGFGGVLDFFSHVGCL